MRLTGALLPSGRIGAGLVENKAKEESVSCSCLSSWLVMHVCLGLVAWVYNLASPIEDLLSLDLLSWSRAHATCDRSHNEGYGDALQLEALVDMITTSAWQSGLARSLTHLSVSSFASGGGFARLPSSGRR